MRASNVMLFLFYGKGEFEMPKGSRGGQGGNEHLGNYSGSGGYKGSVGSFPQKKNPFKPFKTYQKDFASANDLTSLKKVLEDNGVVMSDKFENYIATGRYPLHAAKSFMKGALLTMSHYGDGEQFVGFGAFDSSRSGTLAQYSYLGVVGEQAKGNISVNVGHPSSRGKGIYGTGAHEAYHQVEALMGDRKGITSAKYSESVVKDVYGKWASNKANQSSGNIKTDVSTHISSYGATNNKEALSEAMKNVANKGHKASTLSKDIYKYVKADSKKYKK